MNPETQRVPRFFPSEAEYLRKVEDAFRRLSRSRHVKMKRTMKPRDFEDCRQAIFSSDGIYCGLLREQVDASTCRSCPFFDFEPQEYKLFIRI